MRRSKEENKRSYLLLHQRRRQAHDEGLFGDGPYEFATKSHKQNMAAKHGEHEEDLSNGSVLGELKGRGIDVHPGVSEGEVEEVNGMGGGGGGGRRGVCGVGRGIDGGVSGVGEFGEVGRGWRGGCGRGGRNDDTYGDR